MLFDSDAMVRRHDVPLATYLQAHSTSSKPEPDSDLSLCPTLAPIPGVNPRRTLIYPDPNSKLER